jgi:hypothetical protein
LSSPRVVPLTKQPLQSTPRVGHSPT